MKRLTFSVLASGIPFLVSGMCGIIITLSYDNMLGRPTVLGPRAQLALVIFSLLLLSGLLFIIRSMSIEHLAILNHIRVSREMTAIMGSGHGKVAHRGEKGVDRDVTLKAVYMSFALAQAHDFRPGTVRTRRKMLRLREYIKYRFGLDVDISDMELEIAGYVDIIKNEKKSLVGLAETFKGNRRVPIFRLGSAFCPECGIFKDYEKECPYCSNHEVSF